MVKQQSYLKNILCKSIIDHCLYAWHGSKNVKLSQLIDIINNRFRTDFDQADQLFFDQIVETAANYDEL